MNTNLIGSCMYFTHFYTHFMFCFLSHSLVSSHFSVRIAHNTQILCCLCEINTYLAEEALWLMVILIVVILHPMKEMASALWCEGWVVQTRTAALLKAFCLFSEDCNPAYFQQLTRLQLWLSSHSESGFLSGVCLLKWKIDGERTWMWDMCFFCEQN